MCSTSGHVEIVDGQPVMIERVTFSPRGTERVYQRLGITARTQAVSLGQPRRTAPQGQFLKGPIPLPWLQQAAALPGKAFHVGVVVWYLVGLTSTHTVRVTRAVLKRFGVQHETGRRALRALEQAGLLRVERQGRQSPR